MNLPRTVRKIRACENEVAAQLLFENIIKEIRRSERKKVWDKINSMIITGDVSDNGLDKTAMKNGLILACNKIQGMR